MAETEEWVSPAQLARAAGLTREGVYGLIRTGRIPPDAVRKAGKFMSVDLRRALAAIRGTALPEPAEEPSRPRRAAPEMPAEGLSAWPRDLPPIDESNAAERYWRARRAELDYRRAAGDLVPAADVAGAYADEVAACRTKLLAVVSRVRQRVVMSEEEYALVEDLIREALEELGRSGGAPREEDGEDADL